MKFINSAQLLISSIHEVQSNLLKLFEIIFLFLMLR